MAPRNYESSQGRNVLVKDLNVVHASWVLKKKRKKMQGERGWSMHPSSCVLTAVTRAQAMQSGT